MNTSRRLIALGIPLALAACDGADMQPATTDAPPAACGEIPAASGSM